MPNPVEIVVERDPQRGGPVGLFVWVYSGSAQAGWVEQYRTGFADVSGEEVTDPVKVAAKNRETAAGDGHPLALPNGSYVAIVVSMVRSGVNGRCGYRVTIGNTVIADRMDTDIGAAHSDSFRDEAAFVV